MYIHSDDKELFRKCREIWNKITELIGKDNPTDFIETTDWDKYRNSLVIVLHSVINDFPQTSLVQYRY